MNIKQVPDAALIQELLIRLGENPEREGLKDTPSRVMRMLWEMLETSYREKALCIPSRLPFLFKAVFTEECDEMVLVRDIDFTSLCEHHMLPFIGKVHIGYLPDGKVLGLSKFARVVEHFSRKLQVQERLTKEIAEAIQDHLKPKGVGVIIESSHLCMKIRGVRSQNSDMVTSALLGNFKTDPSTRNEFLRLVKGCR